MAFIEKQGDILSSLNKTISFLDNMDGFLDELADGVKSTSQSVYSTINGKYEGWYDGNPLDVTFNKENTENGKSVVASGTSLLFLEFGTGAYKKEHEAQSDFADQGIVPHGSTVRVEVKVSIGLIHQEEQEKYLLQMVSMLLPLCIRVSKLLMLKR